MSALSNRKTWRLIPVHDKDSHFFLFASVPDSPHEPDPEPYEPMPPRLIPLDEVSKRNQNHSLILSRSQPSCPLSRRCVSLQDSSMEDDGYGEPMDTSSHQAQTESSKLPPVLANLMNLNSNARSPQATSAVQNPAAPVVNVQELLTSIMVPIRRLSDVMG